MYSVQSKLSVREAAGSDVTLIQQVGTLNLKRVTSQPDSETGLHVCPIIRQYPALADDSSAAYPIALALLATRARLVPGAAPQVI